MPAQSTAEKTKMKLVYEEGSKTYSNVSLAATDQQLYDTAVAMSALQSTPIAKLTKIVESDVANV